jgi:hypothetical protein
MKSELHESNARAYLLLDMGEAMRDELVQIVEELKGMRLDLDRIGDPIQRPPFSVADVAAAMSSQWPPENEFNVAAKEWNKDRDGPLTEPTALELGAEARRVEQKENDIHGVESR